MPESAHKRQPLTSTVYAAPLMTSTTALGMPIRLPMLELRETGDWELLRFGSLSMEAPIFFSRTFFHNFGEIGHENFFPEIGQGFWLQLWICRPSATSFRPRNQKKTKNSEIGQL